MKKKLPENHSESFSDVKNLRNKLLAEIVNRQDYGLNTKRNLTFKERNF